MLTLYYASGSCSLSPHIALREAGVPFELDKVDLMRAQRLDSGGTFTSVSEKGYVPALRLDTGELLTEGVAIVQYIADLRPEKQLAPPPGSFERVRLQEWLNFIATELHKGFSPLCAKQASDGYKAFARERLVSRLALLAKGVTDKPFLLGERFTVADGYAFYVLRTWTRVMKGELPGELAAYFARLSSRPAVRQALQAEGFTVP
ncbi:glutathione transferase GstA [Stigmatella erecta]|uniref:Glutathione S-transferase n=1 Tax=Stigmatella erecta TaxID=83460 RepID=A0A1I0CK52_9BACT|nr:glutathione transferase GstA [Stigmatella erecta]SET19797.1 glutathione S-transferase [Stigmatella erecta]